MVLCGHIKAERVSHRKMKTGIKEKNGLDRGKKKRSR